MAISDLLYKIALAREGVGQESTLDKLNKTFQTIGGIGTQIQQRRQAEAEAEMNAIKKKQIEAELSKTAAEAEKLKQENLPAYTAFGLKAPGELKQERQFGEEMVQSPESSVTSPDRLPTPTMQKRVFVKSEPVYQTEQSLEEEYNKLPISKKVPYPDMMAMSNGRIQDILLKNATQKETRIRGTEPVISTGLASRMFVNDQLRLSGQPELAPEEDISRDQFNKIVADNINKQNQSNIPASEMGRLTLADEALNSIDQANSLLYPTGDPSSFRRDVAIKANPPIYGQLTGSAVPFSEEGQNVRRWLGTALSGRQLIQTGVAARPDETESLVNNFMAGWATNPEAGQKALNQLYDFYANYRKNLFSRGKASASTPPPSGLGKQKPTNSKNPTPSPKPDATGYVVGQPYKMKDGNMAVYKGNGRFE